jgi:TRAP transporter TAXI family solute receptor
MSRKRTFREFTLIISLAVAILFTALIIFGGQPAQAQQKKTAQLITTKIGSFGYVTGLALTDIVNKNSKTVKIDFAEGPGTLANIQALVATPSLRPKSIVKGGEGGFFKATKGMAPFNKPYTDLRVILMDTAAPYQIVTLDPNIKTIADFKGKRFSPGAASYDSAPVYVAMLEILGIKDSVKVSYMDFDKTKDAMIDGLLDVGVQGFLPAGGGKMSTNPAAAELMAGRKVYFVDIPANLVKPVADKIGMPWTYYTMKAKSLTPEKPEKDMHSYGQFMGYYADKSLDDDIVYEFTKWTYEKCEEVWPTTAAAKSLNKQDMVNFGPHPLSMVHPGAMKYFKEKGIKVIGAKD